MCIASNEPGGPRRCAAETRRRLAVAGKRLAGATAEMNTASANLAAHLAQTTSPDLSDNKVRHCQLTNLDLRDSAWRGTVIANTNLAGTNLSNVDFTGALIHRCNFTDCDVTDAVFSHASVDSSLAGAISRGRVPMGLDLNEWSVAGGVLVYTRQPRPQA